MKLYTCVVVLFNWRKAPQMIYGFARRNRAKAFPSEPLDPNRLDEKIPKNDKGLRVFDRLILPYQAISYIRLTASKPNRVTLTEVPNIKTGTVLLGC